MAIWFIMGKSLIQSYLALCDKVLTSLVKWWIYWSLTFFSSFSLATHKPDDLSSIKNGTFPTKWSCPKDLNKTAKKCYFPTKLKRRREINEVISISLEWFKKSFLKFQKSSEPRLEPLSTAYRCAPRSTYTTHEKDTQGNIWRTAGLPRFS